MDTHHWESVEYAHHIQIIESETHETKQVVIASIVRFVQHERKGKHHMVKPLCHNRMSSSVETLITGNGFLVDTHHWKSVECAHHIQIIESETHETKQVVIASIVRFVQHERKGKHHMVKPLCHNRMSSSVETSSRVTDSWWTLITGNQWNMLTIFKS